MIIACPECAGPFDLPAQHIAELVQIECPHCSFRMILDFAAANDPSLVEAGMRMASGFRSAAEYRRFTHSPVEEPTPAAARHLEPVPAQPSPSEVAPEPAVATTPGSRPPRSRAPAPIRAPGRAVDAEVATQHPDVVAAQQAAARSGGTVVGPAPVPPPGHPVAEPDVAEPDVAEPDVAEPDVAEPDVAEPARDAVSARAPSTSPPARPVTREPEVRAKPQVEIQPEREIEPTSPLPTEAKTEAKTDSAGAVERIPPHTPPAPSAQSRSGDSGPEPVVPAVAETSGADLDIYEKQLHGSRAGTVLLVFLLLLAGGLVGASVALEGTPDPRPLLEDLYRQAFKR
jgi:DNA-directed RNA polymerase subunit RPC12/RpoP